VITVQASSTLTLSSGSGTDAQLLCNNTPLTDITYTVGGAATGASVVAPTAVVDGLPSGVTGSFVGSTFTITGTPNVTVAATTVFTYTVNTTGNAGGCEEAQITGTITVEPAQAITLVSLPTLTSQDVCVGGTIDDIVYELSGSSTTISPTDIVSIDLPAGLTVDTTSKTAQTQVVTVTTGGVTGTYVVAINGETYSHSATGTSTVNSIASALRTAISGGTALVSVGGSADGISLTALTAGVAFDARIGGTVGGANMSTAITQVNVNRVIIGGTVSAAATQTTYNYTLTTTGGVSCTTTASLGGVITVQASSTLTLSSGSGTDAQLLCNNTPLTDITYTVGGAATGASVVAPTAVVDGLPSGVTGSFVGSTFTITGTPNVTVAATTVFTYTVNTTGNAGGCEEAQITGTITVEPAQAITLVSLPTLTSQDVCVGGTIDDIVYELSGSSTTISPTDIVSIDLPAGLTVDTTSKTAQTQVVTVTTGGVTGTYVVAINGETYSHSATGTSTVNSIASALRTAISGGTALVSVGGSADGISLTALTAGVAFDARIGGTVGGANMSTAITQVNVNRVIIGGTVSAAATQTTYNYTLTTTGGVSCTTTASLGGVITVQASSTLTLSSGSGTDAQLFV
jgi:hypothetical protein